MRVKGVSVAIVVGARESRVHGEGGQGIDVRRTISRRSSGEVQVSLVNLATPMKEEPMIALREVANHWRAGCPERGTSGSEGGVRKHDS
jgi:hypothetical protein